MEKQQHQVNHRLQHNAAIIYLEKCASRVNLENAKHIKIILTGIAAIIFILFCKLIVAL